MSALSDVGNAVFRDIAVAGDVRDDPQWRALLGQGRKRRRIKHTPGGHTHNQDSHGNGNGVDVIPNPLDKLKLASRIDLKPGERLLSSQRIRTRADADGWDLMIAEVDTPNGRQVRLGIIHPDDSKHWTGGPDPQRASRIAELDAEIEQLENSDDASQELSDRLGELQSERGELVEFDAGNLNRTAIIDSAAVAKMREDIDAGIERAKAWSKAWKKLAAEADGDDSRWDALGDNDQYFIEGSVPGGPEGDLHYLVGGVDDGEASWEIRLGVKPPSARDDRYWSIGNNGDAAVFAGSDVKKLLNALQELESSDQPKSSRRTTQAKHGSHNQEDHGNRGVDLIPPMAGLPVLDDDEYSKAYGTVLDERSISSADGIDLQVRVFELGDAHVVLDLPGGRHQVMSDFDDTDGMRALADDIRAMRDTEIPDVEPAGELIADADSHQHDYYTGVDDLGNIWLRSSDQAEDDYLELSEDEANDLANALDDLADSLDEEFGDAAEIEIVGGKSLRKHGTHDQRTHGRRRAGAVLDVPDVPAPKPVAEPKPPKPPKPPRAPKPKPKPKPKPPSEAPKPRTPRRPPAPARPAEPKPSGSVTSRDRAVSVGLRQAADEVNSLPPLGGRSPQRARQIANGALDDVEDLGRADLSSDVEALRADLPGLQPGQVRERLRQLAERVSSTPRPDAPDPSAGGGSGVRDVLRKAKTAKEVSAAAQKESERITDAGVFFHLDGADTEVARELAEGVLRGLERFPDADLSRVRLGKTRRDAVMATADGDEILISADWASDPTRYRDTMHHQHAEGHLVGDSPMATAIHEFGHIVAMTGDSEKSSGKLLLSTAKAQSVDDAGVRDFVQSQISTYAASDDLELTAEAFADVMLNGDKASDLSKVIFSHVEQQYKRAVRR